MPNAPYSKRWLALPTKNTESMIQYVIFVFIFLSLPLGIKAQNVNNSKDSIKDNIKIDLKEDLAKYNGFYTAIESANGKIPIDEIPQKN